MATKYFCDRCGDEIERKRSAALICEERMQGVLASAHGSAFAHQKFAVEIRSDHDLCLRCICDLVHGVDLIGNEPKMGAGRRVG